MLPLCTETILEAPGGSTTLRSPIQIEYASHNSSTRLLCDKPVIYRASLEMSFCLVVLSGNLDDPFTYLHKVIFISLLIR